VCTRVLVVEQMADKEKPDRASARKGDQGEDCLVLRRLEEEQMWCWWWSKEWQMMDKG
jgi:hypothetical protein